MWRMMFDYYFVRIQTYSSRDVVDRDEHRYDTCHDGRSSPAKNVSITAITLPLIANTSFKKRVLRYFAIIPIF